MILTIILAVIFIAAAGIIIFIRQAPQFGSKPDGERLERIKQSSNYRNGHFVNNTPTTMQSPDNSFANALIEYFKGGQDRTPETPPPIFKVKRDIFYRQNMDEVQVTWLGHSSLLIQLQGKSLLTDPMFGKRASPVPFIGPKRFNDTLPLSPEDIPALDAIILSHDHYDHLDYWSIQQLHHKTKHFYVPLGVGAHLERWGVAPEKIIELDWWQETDFSDNIKLIATPSRHFSGRGPSGRNTTLWTSWVIAGAKYKIYFGADSGYGPHFKEIGDKYGPFDLTMLENGAYSQYWPFIHMMPEQTAQAHLDLRGKVLLPIHWAQFCLSLHPWTEPVERLLKKAKQENITVATPHIGETFTINKQLPQTYWWREMKTK